MKRLIIAAALLIMLTTASCTAVPLTIPVPPSKDFHLSADTTDNSSLTLKGATKPGTLIQVFIKKNNQYRLYKLVASSSGVINRQVYFPFGAGEYTIAVGEATSLNHFDGQATFKAKNTDNRTELEFLLPDLDIESDDPKIIAAVQSITKGVTDDYDKAKAIHDWVAQNVAYDVGQLREYTAIETLMTKKAVCDGYAKLTVALCRAIGMKAKYVHGTLNFSQNQGIDNHAWAEIYADHRWISVDTTLDAGGININTQKFEKRFSRKYFDPSSAEFAKDHQKVGYTFYSVESRP